MGEEILKFLKSVIAWILAIIMAIFGFFSTLFKKITGKTDPTTAITETSDDVYSETTQWSPYSTNPTEPTSKGQYTYTGPGITTTEGGTYVRGATEGKKTSFGGSNVDTPYGSDCNDSFCYVCGCTISSDGDFSDSIPSNGGSAGFLAKYDINGNLIWIRAKSDRQLKIYYSDVAILSNGQIAVTGYCMNSRAASGQTLITSAFIDIYSSDGTLVKTISLSGEQSDYFNCITAVSDGFIAGGNSSSVTGDFEGMPECSLGRAILFSFDLEGNIVWRRYLSGSYGASIEDVDSDNTGNIFVTCTTKSTDGSFSSFEKLKGKNTDSVILKYDSNGSEKWHFVVSSTGVDNILCIAADGSGGCIAGGYYDMLSKSYPDGTLEGVYSAGKADALVLKLNSDGQLSWHRLVGGMGNDYIDDICIVNGGYAAVGHTESGDREFPYNYGESDGFVDFISPNGNKVSCINHGGSESDVTNTVCCSGKKVVAFGYSDSTDAYFEGLNTNVTNGMLAEISNPYDCFCVAYDLTIR